MGSDTQQSPCAVPTPSLFIRRACRLGGWWALGSDSLISVTPRPPSGQQLAFQAKAQLNFQFLVDSLISSAVLAPNIVQRAFNQPLVATAALISSIEAAACTRAQHSRSCMKLREVKK